MPGDPRDNPYAAPSAAPAAKPASNELGSGQRDASVLAAVAPMLAPGEAVISVVNAIETLHPTAARVVAVLAWIGAIAWTMPAEADGVPTERVVLNSALIMAGVMAYLFANILFNQRFFLVARTDRRLILLRAGIWFRPRPEQPAQVESIAYDQITGVTTPRFGLWHRRTLRIALRDRPGRVFTVPVGRRFASGSDELVAFVHSLAPARR